MTLYERAVAAFAEGRDEAGDELLGQALHAAKLDTLPKRLPVEQSTARQPTVSTLRTGVHGSRNRSVSRDASSPLTVATDASFAFVESRRRRRFASGHGYATDSGCWGFRGNIYDCNGLAPDGYDPVVENELRAIYFALTSPAVERAAGPVLVLSDSAAAISLIGRWQTGDTVTMPHGYSVRDRLKGSGVPTLVRLAELVNGYGCRLAVEWVRGHNRHVLNEVADSLAKIGRASMSELRPTAAAAIARAESVAEMLNDVAC